MHVYNYWVYMHVYMCVCVCVCAIKPAPLNHQSEESNGILNNHLKLSCNFFMQERYNRIYDSLFSVFADHQFSPALNFQRKFTCLMLLLSCSYICISHLSRIIE